MFCTIGKSVRTVFLSVVAAVVCSCGSFVENSQKYRSLQAKCDSLQHISGIQTQDLDEAFAALNEIENGLKNIRESENILAIKSQQGLEVPEDSRRKIQDDISAIGGAIRQYQDEIQRLKENSKIKSAEFKKRLSAMQRELNEKMSLITDLQRQLEEKEKIIMVKSEQINDLDKIVSDLKSNVADLNVESSALKEKVKSQERELYSVFYIVGSKQELITAGVLTKGGLFKSSKVSYKAEKDAFVKIDYREINTINTNAPKAKILSVHPKGTYSMEKVGDEVLLTISDPDEFWEQTKYLVIQIN